MQVRARTYLTSGIAALGVGAIALTPMQPLPDHHLAAAPQHAVESLAVNLAASIDPFTPIVDTFKATVANVQTLVDFYLQKPFPLLQTIGANVGTYFKELTNGQAALIPQQISNNVKVFFEAPWSPGKQSTNTEAGYSIATGQYISDTDIGVPFAQSQKGTYLTLLAALAGTDPAQIKTLSPLFNFLNTHYSGQIVGLLGPVLSPAVALGNSVNAIIDNIKNGQILGAINELINIPVNMTNAFLNGAGYLDLTDIVKKIQPLPDAISKFGVNLGGLFNSMPVNGSVLPGEDPPTAFSGGVGFDSVAATATLPGLPPVSTPGLPNGWAGAVVGLGQFLSREMLVTPPLQAATAAAAPAAAAATPAIPATPAVPATDEAPAIPAVPATPAVPDIPAIAEAPSAPAADAPADTPAPTRGNRGGGSNSGGSNAGGHGHRGAA